MGSITSDYNIHIYSMLIIEYHYIKPNCEKYRIKKQKVIYKIKIRINNC
jgi:hypothetical protein